MNRRICFFLILTLLIAGIAEAQTYDALPRAETWDFSIMTRYSWSQSFTGEGGANIDLGDDLGWGFGFGYYLSENFNLGLEFLWHSFHYTAKAVSGDDPNDTSSFSNVLDTGAFVITGEYTFGQNRFMPYLAANLGWVNLDTNITTDIDTGCWWYPYYGYVCDGYADTYSSDEFTYGLGVGLRFQMTPGAFLKIGYEHSWVDLESYGGNNVMRIDLGFSL